MKNQKHTVRKVIDYIEEHLEEELNLEQIAERMQVIPGSI